jgi:hypothetical protein
VQRAIGGGAFAPFGAALPGTAISVTDGTALSGTTYRYRLIAKSASLDSGYSNDVSLTTMPRAQHTCLPASDAAIGSVTGFLQEPTEAQWRSAHGITATQASSLHQLTDASDAALCRHIDSMMVKKPAFYFRAGGYIIATDAAPLVDPVTGRAIVSHRQHIFVFDSVGWFAYFPGMTGQPAFMPTGLRVLNASAGKVRLGWDIQPVSAVTYQPQRAIGRGAFTNVGSTLSTGEVLATDSGVLNGNSYRYRLMAKTARGDSGYTNVVSVTVARRPSPH